MTQQAIIDFLTDHRNGRILLAAHQRPDGDAIGSCLGLAYALSSQGYDVAVAAPFPVPPSLRFLLEGAPLVDTSGDGWRGFTCMGVLDCGEIGRLDDVNRAAATDLPLFNIDHHLSSGGIGRAVWNEPQASSTGEMVVRLCRGAGWALPRAAAEALWTAIVTDTGRFSFENTLPAALDAARDCVLAGADPSKVAGFVYQSVSPAERRLQARILERMELSEGGRLATAWLEERDFFDAGAGVEGVQDLINLLRDTAGVEVAALFYEMAGADGRKTVKASLRTASPHNAIDVAGRFGGGGHMRAAGCSLDAPLAEAREKVLGAIRRLYFAPE